MNFITVDFCQWQVRFASICGACRKFAKVLNLAEWVKHRQEASLHLPLRCICTQAFSRALNFRVPIYKEIIAGRVKAIAPASGFVKLYLLSFSDEWVYVSVCVDIGSECKALWKCVFVRCITWWKSCLWHDGASVFFLYCSRLLCAIFSIFSNGLRACI